MRHRKILSTIAALIAGICIGLSINRKVYIPDYQPGGPTEATAPDTLTDWQIMTMAMIEVESENNSDAISDKNARGILQETEIYIADVNRLTGWNISHMDAHDNHTALLCFDVVQGHYNPDKDINTAIRIHNPKAGNWYQRRVLRKIDEIKQREQIRTLIIQFADNRK